MTTPNELPGFFQSTVTPAQDTGLLFKSSVPLYPTTPNSYPEYSLSGKKTTRNYARTMLKGVQTVSDFSLIFFSPENIEEIQKLIKYNVLKIANAVIDNQDEFELVVIMRKYYLEYAVIPASKEYYTTAILNLNNLVINRCMRIVLSSLTQYQKYLYDSSNQPVLLDHPKNVSVSGTRNIRDISDIMFSTTSNLT